MTDLTRFRFGWLPALSLTAAVLAGPALAQDTDTEEPADEPQPVAIAEAMDAPFFVTWVNAAVREQPDGGSTRLATLAFGEQIFVTGRVQGGPWYRVELDDGTIGYVWMEVLEPLIVALPGQGSAPGQEETGPSGISDDNTMATAQVISQVGPSASVFEGTVGPQDTSDFYRFTLDDWTQVTLTLDGLTADADITLLDADGQYLADSVAAGVESEFIEYTTGPGTYFIEIYMYQGETPYQLSITGVPAEPPPADTVGDAPTDALDLGTVGTAAIGHDEWIGHGDPVDYYAFTVVERATVTVTMDGLAADADISLEDDFGSVLASSAEGGTNPEYMQSVLEPGEYFLAIVPFSGNTAYHIEVSAQPAGPAPEDHAGNSATAARQVTLTPGTPAEFRDWVGGADTSDYYTFTVDTGGLFRLVLDGLASDADVELLADDGTSVLASSLLAGTDSELIEYQLQPGTYYVRVYVFSGTTDYRLEMTVR